jgi:hypothetical protein
VLVVEGGSVEPVDPVVPGIPVVPDDPEIPVVEEVPVELVPLDPLGVGFGVGVNTILPVVVSVVDLV